MGNEAEMVTLCSVTLKEKQRGCTGYKKKRLISESFNAYGNLGHYNHFALISIQELNPNEQCLLPHSESFLPSTEGEGRLGGLPQRHALHIGCHSQSF